MQKAKYIQLFLFIALRVSLFSQESSFDVYTVNEGLPFVNVSCMYQDKSGYLWCGGYGGLSRFDGTNFKNYSPREGLANYSVNAIIEDNDRNLWVGTISGLSRVYKNKFTNYQGKEYLSNNNITSIAYDPNKNMLWIGTRNGLNSYDGKKFTQYDKSSGIMSTNINSLCIAGDGSIVIGTDIGLCVLTNNRFVSYPDFSSNILNVYHDGSGTIWVGSTSGVSIFKNEKLNHLFEKFPQLKQNIKAFTTDRDGNTWMASDKGLYKYDGETIINIKPRSDQNSNLISSLITDREQNVWVGTYSGLFRYKNSPFVVYNQNQGLQSNFIFPILRDKQQHLWVGTSNGLYKYDGEKFNIYTANDGLVNDYITAATVDANGNLWAGSWTGGISMYDGKKFKTYLPNVNNIINGSILGMITDSKNRVWAGGRNGITIFEGDKINTVILDSTAEADLTAIYEDKNGIVWLGAYKGELYKCDGGEFTPVSQQLKMKSNSYMAITGDKRGFLYVGTFDGVFMYDGNNTYNFSISEGLSSNLVYSMGFQDESENYLLVGTNQGLSKIDIGSFIKNKNITIHNYGKSDGFYGVECNTGGGFKDIDGSLWFGTVDGLINYKPDINYINNATPTLNLSKIQLFYEDTVFENGTTLDYHLNNISFQYKAICLTNPAKVLYKHKLEGYETNWTPATKDNQATYSNLGPGKYTLNVIACNNEGVWASTPLTFEFTIATPFWKTWWFRTITIVLFVLISLAIVRYRISSIRKTEQAKNKIKIEMATQELKALRSQMNPHFIFNSLNAIQHFIMNKDEGLAGKYLNKFAKLIRTILNNSEKSTVTLSEEIESIKLYLEMEAMRFENIFDYSIEVDAAIDTDYFEIPSMLIQPFIENAILHGLTPKKEKGHLKLMFRMNENQIVCCILDDGIGRKRSAMVKEQSVHKSHASMGMKITTDRLNMLNTIHKTNLGLIITDLEDVNGNGTGTKVEIFIPIA